MQKRWIFILFGSFLFILLMQFSVPCAGESCIGAERTPPKRSAYQIVMTPVAFALKLPFQVLRYTSEGVITGINKSEIVPTYRNVFFNEAEIIGIYPMPSISPGSGLGGGFVFFYDDFLKPDMDLKVETSATTNSEQGVGFSLIKPKWMNDRLYTSFLVRYDYDPDRDFHGIGFDSAEETRTNFSLRRVHTQVDFGTNLTATIYMGGNLGHLWAHNAPGKDYEYDSIEERFEKSQVLVFDESLSFVIPQFSLGHDNAKPKGRPNTGGREEFTAALYQELTDKKFRFIHYELQLARYFHLFLERTLAARVRVEMNSPVGAEYETPFFLLSQLGGADTLRGYNTGRFYGKDSVLATLEYRFPIWRYPLPPQTHQLDFRIFADVGRVFDDIFDEFTLKDMKLCGGAGLRFSTAEEFIFRLEIAKSSEQWSAIFKQKVIF